MKAFILVDKDNIVRCIASDECNLHKDKLWMKKFLVDWSLEKHCGDEYDSVNDVWIPHPENYPPEDEETIIEKKISDRIRKIAIDQLKEEGEIPEKYEEVR